MTDLRRALESDFGATAVLAGRPRLDGPEVPLIVPRDLEQASEIVRYCASEKLALAPVGLGSKLGWCAPATRLDLLLSTRALTQVVSHEPGDGTLTAQAGITMSELRERAAGGGHWLTPDVPRPRESTLGGVLAASQSGPDRLRHGPVRHHVLGMRVVLADGAITRSGGQLVKNVTGYDLHRLYCGSHGTLCVIVEASLRLFPLPEHQVWLTTAVRSRGEMLERAATALALPIRLHSLTASRLPPSSSQHEWQLSAMLSGRRAPVEGERAELLREWPSAENLDGTAALHRAAAMRDRAFDARAGPSIHVTCRPAALAATLEVLARALESSTPPQLWIVEPGLATIDVLLRPPRTSDSSRLATIVLDLRAKLAPSHGRVALRDAAAASYDSLDPIGAPAAGLGIMRSLKQRLDPEGLFAPGRFHGGI